jgi:hypothetical protein
MGDAFRSERRRANRSQVQLAQLTALLIGGTLALGTWVLASTCRARGGRWLSIGRSVLPVVDTGVLALASMSAATPGIKALAAVAFAVAFLALAIDLTAQRAEPAWWASFESAFWRYLEHGVGDEPA